MTDIPTPTWGRLPNSNLPAFAPGQSIGQIQANIQLQDSVNKQIQEAYGAAIANGAPIAAAPTPVTSGFKNQQDANAYISKYYQTIPNAFDVNSGLKSMQVNAKAQGLKVPEPVLQTKGIYDQAHAQSLLDDYAKKINAANTVQYFDVDTQLKQVYDQYIKDGGSKTAVSLPPSHGTSVQDATQAKAIIDKFVNTLNSNLASSPVTPSAQPTSQPATHTVTPSAQPATHYYDVDSSLQKIYSEWQNTAGTKGNLSAPVKFGQTVTDSAKAQSLINDYLDKANKAMPVVTTYDVAGSLQQMYKNLTSAGFGNVPQPPSVAGQTFHDSASAQTWIDNYYKTLSSANLLSPSDNLNNVILNGGSQAEINALAKTAGWSNNIDPQKTSGYQFVLKLDPVLTQRYLDAKAANVGLSEYDWRASHDQNTLTTKGAFTALNYSDAVRDSSMSTQTALKLASQGVSTKTGSNQSALDNSAVLKTVIADMHVSDSVLASSLAHQTQVKPIVVSAQSIAPSQLQDKYRVQQIEKGLGEIPNKVATANTVVSKIMADNAHLTTSQIMDKENGTNTAINKINITQPTVAKFSMGLEDQLKQVSDYGNIIKSALASYTPSSLPDLNANLKPYNPQSELSGTENPYAIDKESELDAINFHQPALNVVSDILKDAGKVANYSYKTYQEELAEADKSMAGVTEKIPSANDLGISNTVTKAMANTALIPGLNVVSDIISEFSSSSVGKTIIKDIEKTGLLTNPVITRLEANLKTIDDIVKPIQTVAVGVGNYTANSFDYARQHPATTQFKALAAYETGVGFGQLAEGVIGGLEIATDLTKVTSVLTPYVRPIATGGFITQLGEQAIKTAMMGSLDKDLDFVRDLIVGGAGYGEGAANAEEGLGVARNIISKVGEKVIEPVSRQVNLAKLDFKGFLKNEDAYVKMGGKSVPYWEAHPEDFSKPELDAYRNKMSLKEVERAENARISPKFAEGIQKEHDIVNKITSEHASETASPSKTGILVLRTEMKPAIEIKPLEYVVKEGKLVEREVVKAENMHKLSEQKLETQSKLRTEGLKTPSRKPVDITSKYALKEAAKLKDLGISRKMTTAQRVAYERNIKASLKSVSDDMVAADTHIGNELETKEVKPENLKQDYKIDNEEFKEVREKIESVKDILKEAEKTRSNADQTQRQEGKEAETTAQAQSQKQAQVQPQAQNQKQSQYQAQVVKQIIKELAKMADAVDQLPTSIIPIPNIPGETPSTPEKSLPPIPPGKIPPINPIPEPVNPKPINPSPTPKPTPEPKPETEPPKTIPALDVILRGIKTVDNIIKPKDKKVPLVPTTQKQINTMVSNEMKSIRASRLIVNSLGTLF